MPPRRQFTGSISRALGRAETPATAPVFSWRHRVQKDVMPDLDREDLARLFAERSREMGVVLFETPRERLNETIGISLQEMGDGPVILARDPLLDALDTTAALQRSRETGTWNSGEGSEEAIRFAGKAVAGIAVARLALAESATVLLFSHEGCGRAVTLLPESTVAIIPKSCIRPRLTQGMELLRQCRENLPSSAHFVSGPSATSDIELVRVVGVHGPMRVVHIVVSDL